MIFTGRQECKFPANASKKSSSRSFANFCMSFIAFTFTFITSYLALLCIHSVVSNSDERLINL